MHGDIDTANFADDNTYYTTAKNIDDVIKSLEQVSASLFKWFELNLLKGNAGKCHFLTSTDQEVSLIVDIFIIKISECEKLLQVTFDSKLTLDHHHSCASFKVNALARITVTESTSISTGFTKGA